MHKSKYDYLFKLLLIGDSGVGKVLLLASHTHSTPSNLPPCCPAVNESRSRLVCYDSTWRYPHLPPTRSPDTKRVWNRLVCCASTWRYPHLPPTRSPDTKRVYFQTRLAVLDTQQGKRVWNRLVCCDFGCPTPNESISRLVWPCSIPSKANKSGIDSFAALSPGATLICHPPGLPTPNESGNRLVWPRSTPSKASESIPDSFAAIPAAQHQTSLFPDSFGRARHPAKQASLEIDSFAPRATTICHLPSRPAESSLPPHLHFCHARSVGSVVPAAGKAASFLWAVLAIGASARSSTAAYFTKAWCLPCCSFRFPSILHFSAMPRRHHTTASKANESAWKGYAEFLEGQTEATKARLRFGD
ncbi:hypothetical protein F5050DRAFT_1855540 [Lentinula boryana]|uniref:Ras-domain-containing protein n=1 Tax=Lentinula boryana TaxID=40481 RepID=A0ABQ8Q1U5_9AGAR|nr:hypothetical protein F5050DRAFT_1855540 [Lentinula boryana]